MHPIVVSFLEDEELENIPENYSQEENLTVKAIYYLKKAFFDASYLDQAVEACELSLANNEEDFSLTMIFLDSWFRLSARQRRLQECETIINRMKMIQLPKEVSELTLIIDACRASLMGVNKNLIGYIESYQKICENCPSNNKKFGRFFFRLCLPESRRGKLLKYQPKIDNILKDNGSDFLKKRKDILYYFNFLEQCKPQEANQSFEKIKDDNYFKQGLRSSALYSQMHYQLLLTYQSGGFYQEAQEPSEDSNLNQIHLYLLKRQAADALQCTKKVFSADITNFADASFYAYTLIRCELSNRNPDAALWLIKEKRQMGNYTEFDHFFSARVEILKGNLIKAKYHLRKLKGLIDKYQLQERLALEVDLSCELLSNQFNHLLKECDEVDSARISVSQEITKEENKMIIGQSPAIQEVKNKIVQLSNIDMGVLIIGETGTGKELVAKSLHEQSERKNEPYIAINCGAISNSLLQSELFGYEKGAFTGAAQYHKGIFEEAGKGTVFLDEVGEISQQVQVSLLRLLESGEYRPVGGTRPKKINCRVVAATNAPLEELVEKGTFRKDLLYRLERLKIELPPLRKRKDDLELLVLHFIRQMNQRPGIQIEKSLIDALKENSWPGNIRELKNVIERLVILNTDKKILTARELERPYLPEKFALPPQDQSGFFPAISESNLREALENDSKTKISGDIDIQLTEQLFGNGQMPSYRRIEVLKNLFRRYRKLNRADTAKALNVSPNTASSDLKTLLEEGYIEKVMPSKSPRSHYFQWVKED